LEVSSQDNGHRFETQRAGVRHLDDLDSVHVSADRGSEHRNTTTPQHRKEPNPAACKGFDSGLFCTPGQGRRAAKHM